MNGALLSSPGDIHFRAYVACWAANYALKLDGDFVECGVGKGLLSTTIVNYIDFDKTSKKFFLFDTYEGIPLEQAKSNEERLNMEILNSSNYNSNYFNDVKNSFSKYANVFLVQGIVPESLKSIIFSKIAYISIDMNNAFAEIAAIEHLWDNIVIGGVVVLDDYAYGPEFYEQKKAWDLFAESKGFKILTLPTGQGLIVKNTF
jgi:hypothetical protein